mgnify:CR=1 FL=1
MRGDILDDDYYCMNCQSEDERVYIGEGEFLCLNCSEITDFNRIRLGLGEMEG